MKCFLYNRDLRHEKVKTSRDDCCFLPLKEVLFFVFKGGATFLSYDLQINITVGKMPQYREYCSVFSYIRTEYGDLRSKNLRIQSEYRKIRTRNNSVFGHFPWIQSNLNL